MPTFSSGDELLPVATAIERVTGYRPHASTCTRWTRRGVRGEKLSVVVLGGRPKTTEALVLDFISRQTAKSEATSVDP